ncbi:Uncharacterized protein APZ42_032218 [Daphnia magna]|uniref:Uncharacterized protein n=1 Tax=Daphnia magna TaxID=35525 RepID=A0A162D9W9_9CRUS|nr:Uncharacterized protein APZ42_032218 [Daphnia magna]
MGGRKKISSIVTQNLCISHLDMLVNSIIFYFTHMRFATRQRLVLSTRFHFTLTLLFYHSRNLKMVE